MISGSRYENNVQYRKAGRRLTLNYSLCDSIIKALNEIVSACSSDNITSLLLVGGYSESPYMTERIRQ
ncbi:hypothetical protein MAR_032680 [Mya arenaria]|uniref:Uncharacterized protein n=1 Tax=Mya arenaria TaxID=6604 RepID=A0ABY7FFT1_MYAAR|nr:hypothetical protein MAR_032680 [Mya arenaria]